MLVSPDCHYCSLTFQLHLVEFGRSMKIEISILFFFSFWLVPCYFTFSSLPSPPLIHMAQFLIAQWDYAAEGEFELSFQQGDRIKLLEKHNDDW